MDRERAFKELQARVTNIKLIRHSLAVEAIMRELAAILRDNVELWGLTGLLHDIDYEKTADDPARHSILGAEILENLDVDPEIIYAVKAHNDLHGIERKRKLDKALYCSDYMPGIINECALTLPSKKLSDVSADFVLKKLDEKAFAKDKYMEQIKTCSDLGISLEQFVHTALTAMGKISEELGF